MKDLLCLLFLVSTSLVRAEYDPAAALSWQLESSGIFESRLAVYQFEQVLGIYSIDCDLTDANAGAGDMDYAKINVAGFEARPAGVLIVICSVGAHSQQLSIIDPQHEPGEVAYSVTGSYTASWELQDGELWLGFDEPCDTGPTVECPDGFANTFVQYPVAATKAAGD